MKSSDVSIIFRFLGWGVLMVCWFVVILSVGDLNCVVVEYRVTWLILSLIGVSILFAGKK